MSDETSSIMRKLVDAKLQEIHLNREKFLEAFIAETGLSPSEAVMVAETDGPTTRIWFREKTDHEKQFDKVGAEEPRLSAKLSAFNEILGVLSRYEDG
jgi:hypothetical protein